MISGVLLMASVLVDSTEDSNVEVVEATTSTSVVRGAEVDDAVVFMLRIGLVSV
jgi:hypothetical protein